ncbi:MAG TPA: AsmA family protein [Hyphomonas sp.]|nr:AsmA family protein [Hyphomonas sp.]
MKRILLILAGVLGLLVIAALVVPFLVPKEVYKAQIEKAATAALQRDVQLTGDVSVSVFPRISASVGGVTVANPEGFSAPNMIEAGQLRGSVKWLPLLQRRVEVQEIAFVDANVQLEKLADGRANWEFASDSQPESGTASGGGSVDAAVDQARLTNASLTYRDDASGAVYELKDLNLEASLQAMNQPLKAKADGVFQDQKFDIALTLDSPDALTTDKPANVDLKFDSSLAKGTYLGSVTLGDAPAISGDLTATASSLAALAKFAKVDLPVNVEPLGAATVKATLSGALTSPTIKFETLGLKSNLVDLNYAGGLTLGETPTLDGSLKASLPNTGELMKEMGVDVPAEDALEKVQVSGNVRGPADAIMLQGLDVTHSGALINGSYKGDVSLAGDGRINGQVDASSKELRALLAAADVEMAPGETLKAFSSSGAISGTFKKFSLSGLNLTLDDLKATGDAGLDLSGAKPRLTGNLDMGALDLSPFLAAEDQGAKPQQPMTGWSKEPLDLAGLEAVDANLDIRTTTLTLGNVKLDNASIQAVLKDGKLVATLPAFSTFGGNWEGKLALDATAARPALTVDMTGQSVAMSSLLGTLAGFDKLTGTGSFNVSATSSGASIDEIMHALNGTVSTKLSDGALKGLNITQLVRSADSLRQAITTGSLQKLDFTSVLSPEAQTDFTSFDAAFELKDGVAQVDLMKLLNPVLGIDGTGEINLGGQSLDLRLATSIDKKAQGTGSVVQLNGIPVPVRLSGSWTKLKVSPDFSGVTSALAADLGSQVREGLTGQLGGSLGGDAGNVIGDIIGLPKKTETKPENTATPEDGTAETPAEPVATDAEPAKPQTIEDAAKDAAESAARDALGGLFGSKKKKTTEDDTPPESSDQGN